ncbi:hydroxymyristoyl-ACP dehydratase [Xenorhabdus cabanillasii]|uniref:3-hydroxymyristoyl/3-hydroxydecanoyl-(Acyl carrier protein) dehydratase n=2 Tax=Xenorhabdus cabanillasii TaxID=351673 RepID=A0A3D9U9R5_9GAMM|nr:hydroxymyristoyl-ACP dehydratase [Xenorhabdus cabanillasii]PHM75988.1 hydroxymyristoyl-ACP dehydratase [Xenorhabdus cabanillasii JM26]REF26016.1 3-hydroxymyristoyl/3-hydroxydecanoyl-(acyl carrier protein) dehydratase [Xenorhabdus cabanillasii]CDL86536.1 putative acyl carrier protein dehydratase [Xenorhabdus cabanillasii JM26]
MNPIEIHLEQPAPNEAIIRLYLDPDLSWFRGHFPVQPLLPGVAQIDWVMHYAQTLLAPGWAFSSIEMVKFQFPLQPEDNLLLKLQWEEKKHLLTFQYDVETPNGGEYKTASQGKIKLCH